MSPLFIFFILHLLSSPSYIFMIAVIPAQRAAKAAINCRRKMDSRLLPAQDNEQDMDIRVVAAGADEAINSLASSPARLTRTTASRVSSGSPDTAGAVAGVYSFYYHSAANEYEYRNIGQPEPHYEYEYRCHNCTEITTPLSSSTPTSLAGPLLTLLVLPLPLPLLGLLLPLLLPPPLPATSAPTPTSSSTVAGTGRRLGEPKRSATGGSCVRGSRCSSSALPLRLKSKLRITKRCYSSKVAHCSPSPRPSAPTPTPMHIRIYIEPNYPAPVIIEHSSFTSSIDECCVTCSTSSAFRPRRALCYLGLVLLLCYLGLVTAAGNSPERLQAGPSGSFGGQEQRQCSCCCSGTPTGISSGCWALIKLGKIWLCRENSKRK